MWYPFFALAIILIFVLYRPPVYLTPFEKVIFDRDAPVPGDYVDPEDKSDGEEESDGEEKSDGEEGPDEEPEE